MNVCTLLGIMIAKAYCDYRLCLYLHGNHTPSRSFDT